MAAVPEVSAISKSFMVTSIGNNFYTYIKHNSPDSSMAWYNKIDENYINVLGLKLIAGQRFHPHAENEAESEVIVNQTLINQLRLGNNNPDKALGEFLTIDGKKLQIVGVVKDFHSNTLDGKIKPFLFRYGHGQDLQYLNVKIQSKDLPSTMDKLSRVWRKIDGVHPIQSKFYDESIQQAYSEYASMIKVVGYISFLAVAIASLGLLGMVMISAESRRSEISIRKVFGASTPRLTYLLSKSFFVLLVVSGLVALPVAYLIFDKIILRGIAYHAPIGYVELFSGFLGVLIIAMIIILSQTFKVATTNPAKVLRNE
jgi:ABC-type antimicrobial peptide transport system permease subunit